MSPPQPDQKLIQVLPIPSSLPASSPDLPTLVSNYKTLRLTALQLDPDAFSSTYDREAQFTYETWLSRTQNPRGRTYIAINSTASPDPKDWNQLLDNEWIGQLTLLGPESVSAAEEDSPWMVFLGDDYGGRERGVGAEVDTVYMVMGMFVLPSWRGKGIGKRLIQAALSGVQDARGGSDSTTSRVVVTVMMERDNHGARTLYSSCGFVVGDGAVRVKSRGEWREALAMVQDIK